MLSVTVSVLSLSCELFIFIAMSYADPVPARQGTGSKLGAYSTYSGTTVTQPVTRSSAAAG